MGILQKIILLLVSANMLSACKSAIIQYNIKEVNIELASSIDTLNNWVELKPITSPIENGTYLWIKIDFEDFQDSAHNFNAVYSISKDSIKKIELNIIDSFSRKVALDLTCLQPTREYRLDSSVAAHCGNTYDLLWLYNSAISGESDFHQTDFNNWVGQLKYSEETREMSTSYVELIIKMKSGKVYKSNTLKAPF